MPQKGDFFSSISIFVDMGDAGGLNFDDFVWVLLSDNLSDHCAYEIY